MLKDIYREGNYGDKDLNCSETILEVASDAYGLALDHKAKRLSSAFGGGMCIEEKCGAVSGALMVLGVLFVEDRAHASNMLTTIVLNYLNDFDCHMKSCECSILKKMYRRDDIGCQNVIEESLEILEGIIDRFNDFRVR